MFIINIGYQELTLRLVKMQYEFWLMDCLKKTWRCMNKMNRLHTSLMCFIAANLLWSCKLHASSSQWDILTCNKSHYPSSQLSQLAVRLEICELPIGYKLCVCGVCVCVCVGGGELEELIVTDYNSGLLVNYPWIWPVRGIWASVDVIILESWAGGGQTFTTVLSALAVTKWPSSPTNATKCESNGELWKWQ